MLLLAYPFFLAAERRGLDLPTLFVLMGLVAGICNGTVIGVCADLFPTRIRFSGVAMSFNLSFSFLSGLAPVLSTWLARQTGDPAPLYTLPREFSPKLLLDVGGRLCVSNTSDDHTARAKANRIFLTVKEQDRWNLVYAPFGEIIEGLAVAKGLSEGETIDRVTVEGDRAAIESLRIRFARDLAEWNRAIDAVATQPSR